MEIRCPNSNCNTKISLPENLLSRPTLNLKCPSCKNMFKPYETLSERQKQELLSSNQHGNEPFHVGNRVPNSEKNSDVHGWLVVHDENTHTQTYELKTGRQLIGRKSGSIPCDIMIETNDKTMHRNHFYVTITKRGNQYSYLIEGHESSLKGNQTYIDTRRLSEFEREMKRINHGEQVYIEDGSLIQAGRTKIVLKTLRTVSNKEDATRVVSQQKVTKTVIL